MADEAKVKISELPTAATITGVEYLPSVQTGTTKKVTVANLAPGIDANNTSTTIGVPKGGTGATTLTDHGVLLGSGAGAVTPTAAMTNGQILVGATGADPAPQAVSGAATLASTGVLSLAGVTQHRVLLGDASSVAKSLGAMTDGQLVVGATGASPTAQTISGAFTLAANGVATLTPNTGNPIIAGCTVASDGTATNGKNITSVAVLAGLFTITLTANTATKYAPQVTLTGGSTADPIDIKVEKTSATIWVVTTKVSGIPDSLSFSFALLSLD